MGSLPQRPSVGDRPGGLQRQRRRVEAFYHDQARSRAYRWGEDGIAGFSDDRQLLCLALAVWNGRDPILKERFFGLTNSEGNHGEDVKEYYFYLDATPTHSYQRFLYKYPQAPYPYDELVGVNRDRNRHQFEYEDRRYRRVRRRPLFRHNGRVRQGRGRRRADAGHRGQPWARARRDRRPTDPVVPQHVVRRQRRSLPAPPRARRSVPALFSQNMLELALELAARDPTYEDFALRFVEHFFSIAAAMDPIGEHPDELWDEEDGFFYDVLRLPDGSASRIKVRSMVGLLPCAPPPSSRPRPSPNSPSWRKESGTTWTGITTCWATSPTPCSPASTAGDSCPSSTRPSCGGCAHPDAR